MEKFPEDKLIRTAIVRNPTTGYIYACDVDTEDENPHTLILTWEDGTILTGDCNYNAHSACVVNKPKFTLVHISEQGYYGAHTATEHGTGDILDDSHPLPTKPRQGGFRSVAEIDGKAYTVGLRGMVYRLDKLLKEKGKWTRIDEGLPNTFNIQAIHGFNASDIYAVGRNGEVWHFNGRSWNKLELPTNINLYSVKCVKENEQVYVAGNDGILIRGRDDAWKVVEHGATKDNISDIEWFQEKLYISTRHNLYQLEGDNLVPVDFGKDRPKTFYQLSKAEGVMWANGEYDIMSFDGKKWTRIV
jgi:hypothetical protein